MGVESRVWMQEGRPSADGPVRTASAVALVLLGFWIVFLAVTPGTRTTPGETGRFISEELLLRPAQVLDGAWWQLVTAPLFHGVRAVFHPFIVLFLLYTFGRFVEARGGRRSYWMTVLGGVLIWDVTLLCYARDPRLMGLGMEGPVFALLGWAHARAVPTERLTMGGVDVRIDQIVIVLLIVAGLLLAVARPGGSASSPFPFISAYLLAFGGGQLVGRRGRDHTAADAAESPKTSPRIEEETLLDRLLEKVSRGGLDSLTDEERAALEQASRRKR